MKIALINPPFPPPWILRLTNGYYFPLGLGYIAAYVRQAGHTVKIFDPEPRGLSLEKILKEVEGFRPDLVGITSVTPNFVLARQLALEVKRRLGCLVVMGGPHPNALPRSTLQSVPGLDAVITGEGEIPMLTLANEFDAHGKVDFNKIPGAAFMDGWKCKEVPRPEYITDLDTLPYPARDLVDVSLYYAHRYFFGGIKSTTILSSRGCPGQCTFCANICMGRKFRARSAANFVGEMEYLAEKYGIRHFQIYDDCFTADPKRVAEICDLIIGKRLDITWTSAGRVNTLLDEDLLRKIKRAGCVEILLGTESGNQRILDLMKKGATLGVAEECCRKLRKHGIIYGNSYIIGNEGDTEETILDTVAFAKKMKPDLIAFVILIPFPGTPLFDKYFKDYDRPDTVWTNWCAQDLSVPYPPRQTELSMEDLIRLRDLANQRFHFNPFQLLRTLTSRIRR